MKTCSHAVPLVVMDVMEVTQLLLGAIGATLVLLPEMVMDKKDVNHISYLLVDYTAPILLLTLLHALINVKLVMM